MFAKRRSMNWQAVSFDWNHVKVFLATVEEGSFSGAARALQSTQPTVGRQVSDLEAALGVTLFERSVRGLTLTRSGESLLEHVRAMSDAASSISIAALGQSNELEGEVTITCTDLLAAAFLPKLLAPLRLSAPDLTIWINAVNTIQNLVRLEADIAIRHVRPDQPDLIARHLGYFKASLYAATPYLERAGRPASREQIAEHPFIGTPDVERLLSTLNAMGVPVDARNFAICCANGSVVWEMLKAGLGIAMLPEQLCDTEPGVERVLPGLPSLEFPVWLVTHRALKTNPRIRVVFDRLAEGIADLLSKNQ